MDNDYRRTKDIASAYEKIVDAQKEIFKAMIEEVVKACLETSEETQDSPKPPAGEG